MSQVQGLLVKAQCVSKKSQICRWSQTYEVSLSKQLSNLCSPLPPEYYGEGDKMPYRSSVRIVEIKYGKHIEHWTRTA